MKQKSIYYESIFTLLTLGYVLMDRANETSQAVQRRIQIAIGDVSTYTGGYGDGSSMSGSGINSSGVGNSGGNGAGLGHHSSGSTDASGSSGSSTSKLFKKRSKSSTKSGSNMIGEFTDYLTEEDLAGIDQQLTSAADLYCKAAGVFEYVTQQMIPRWNQRIASVTAALASSSTATVPAGLGKIVPESARPVDVQTSLISAHVR